MSALKPRRPANNPVPIYLILAAGQACSFALIFTVNLIYQATVVGLNPLQMVLVGTVLMPIVFLYKRLIVRDSGVVEVE
ncbi:MAG: hypothetical protein H0U31_06460, partial [Chloroflexia bacterium]|nr:hypothetical protein [Chloroflexia bacterium]